MSEGIELQKFIDENKPSAGSSDEGNANGNPFLKKLHGSVVSMAGIIEVNPLPSDFTSISSDTSYDGSLHQAAREGAVELVRETLKKYLEDGVDILRVIDILDNEGFSPLHHASRYNQKEVIEILINNQAYIDVKGEDENSPLHLAAKYNSLDAANVLVQRGAQINIQNVYGSTPLHFASRRGNTGIAQLLINHSGIDVNIKDNAGVTPLHQAAVSGDTEIAQTLLSHAADTDAVDIEGESPLHFAAEEGNAAVIALLIDHVASGAPEGRREEACLEYVNRTSSELDTPLHLACQGGYFDAVEVLIEKGASVNVRADNLNSPLHLAAVGGHLEVAKHLHAHGAKINARDSNQMTSLHKASLFGRRQVIEFLLEKGAKIDAKDTENFTPLLCAVWKGQTEAAEYLINEKARVGMTDSSMKTCLHIAVEYKHISMLSMLLEHAQSLTNFADKDYQTPMHYAASSGQIQAVQILLEKGGKVDVGDNNERTPLHSAAINGKVQAVSLIGKHSPSILNATDERGRTPLHLAAMNGHVKVVTTLLDLGAEIDGRDDVHWTPLDYAARCGFFKTLAVLLANDAPVDASDKNKNTPLHLASANGHVECVQLLLDNDAQISYRNIEGKNCLDLAVENYERDVCMALVKHKRWKEAVENTDHSGRPPMEKLIEVAPEVAEAVLDKCLESSKHPSYLPEYHLIYNFKYLQVDPNTAKKTNIHFYGPRSMVDFKREKLLSHPVTRKFIDLKWQMIGRIPYFLNLLTYLLFVALVTAFAVIERRNDTNELLKKVQPNSTSTKSDASTSTFVDIVPWLTCALCIFNFAKELLQLLAMGRKYLSDANNYLEWILYISTFIFMFPFLSSVSNDKSLEVSDELRWSAGGISILFTWMNLLLFLQRFPYFGLFVVMFVEVLQTVLKVLSVFAIFIVAFALAFFVLMPHQKTWSSPEFSLMKVLVMTIGELEYDSMFTDARGAKNAQKLPLLPYAAITYIIFAVFAVLMPIIIMNLLVGLAVGDIEFVRKSAFLRILEQQVNILQDLEAIYPRFFLKRTYRPTYVYFPNALPWFDRARAFFGITDRQYEFLKKDETESAGREEEIQRQLESNEQELQKQKRRIKQLTTLVEDQGELLKQMATHMGLLSEHDS